MVLKTQSSLQRDQTNQGKSIEKGRSAEAGQPTHAFAPLIASPIIIWSPAIFARAIFAAKTRLNPNFKNTFTDGREYKCAILDFFVSRV
jgi:hypothetical protein